MTGIGLALLCAAVTQLGFLCKHRGAAQAPRVGCSDRCTARVTLFRSRWFAIGMAIAAGAFVLHVAALALAPLSVVQVALSTGVVMLAVMGERLFGCRVGRPPVGRRGDDRRRPDRCSCSRSRAPAASHAAFAVPALIAFQAGMLALGVLLIAAPRLGTPGHHHGAVLGAAAGTLFGVSDVALKALTDAPAARSSCCLAVAPVAALASVLAFLASARGFQEGEAVPVIACTSTAANVTVITGGIVVFGDALAGGVLLVVQLAAFALIAVSALVTPAGHARPATA